MFFLHEITKHYATLGVESDAVYWTKKGKSPLGKSGYSKFQQDGLGHTHKCVSGWGGEELYIVNPPICQVPDHKQGLIYFLGKAMPMPCVLRHSVRTQVHKING